MNNFTGIKALTGGMLAVMFMFVPTVHALDTDLFLQASSSILLNGSSSESERAKENGETQEKNASTSAALQQRKSTLYRLQALLNSLGRREEPHSKEDEVITSSDMASIKLAKVSDMSATLSWTSPKLTRVTVYYSQTSPVSVSDKTPSASPWKMWNSKQITIRGLVPDTTYYYKVVALTKLGTTTSPEASFKTVAR